MRQQIDCAVLELAAHQSWMPQVLKVAEPALSRIRIHMLEWEAGHHLETDPHQAVGLPIETIAQAAVGLRRYDIALLPVSMETLAWTRQALSVIPRGPFIPMMGIFNEMRSAAIQDLLELGMCDFVRLPVCAEELRARLLAAVTNVPRPGSLREPMPGYGQASWLSKLDQTAAMTISNTVRPTPAVSHAPLKPVKARRVTPRRMSSNRPEISAPNALNGDSVRGGSESKTLVVREPEQISFKAAKAALVDDFERKFVTKALERNDGNIAMAARYADKHRRAFWALMRKHGIDALDFRQDDPEG